MKWILEEGWYGFSRTFIGCCFFLFKLC